MLRLWFNLASLRSKKILTPKKLPLRHIREVLHSARKAKYGIRAAMDGAGEALCRKGKHSITQKGKVFGV
jgi:hypothetical protein